MRCRAQISIPARLALLLNICLLHKGSGDGSDSLKAGEWGWGSHPWASVLAAVRVDWGQVRQLREHWYRDGADGHKPPAGHPFQQFFPGRG